MEYRAVFTCIAGCHGEYDLEQPLYRCPKCGAILKERRAPRRLAGVEERYRSMRILLAALRFLALMVLLIGGLAVFGSLGDPNTSGLQGIGILLSEAIALFA